MWFGVLGPLLVRDGDSAMSVPAGRQRVLLAALLVRAGTVVSADALAEVMWDGAPPAGAETTLRTHVMRLRRVLGPAAGARVVTRYPGYLIEAGESEVDLLRFRGLAREGGMAVRTGDWARAWELLTEALGLWRGEPLGDIPSELLRESAPGLEELRLQVLEWRADAGLHLGRHAELAPELRPLAGQHPLRERFAAQLMLALVRCGRQAEALEAYQRTRGALVEQLGAEPGAELRDLHQRVLTADPTLAAPPAQPTASEAVRPRELPAPVAHFAGRADELAALTGLLDRSSKQTPGLTVISAIGGTAGVGKTALAVYWAHQVADRFPDGQLYVNLRGYDPDRPMTAADVLAGFLRALGVPGQDIPAEEAERAARYRSLLSERRMLIVLDNARSVEQVRPLLPGSPSCAVLVTSRDSLAGLVARDGALRLDLDLLPPAEAVGLLRALIGIRVDDDPHAAAALAAQCCRLPLALRIAAELAVGRSGVPLAELTGELADQHRRLDLLDADGDARTAVRAVFSWSYRSLDDGAARAFRLAGLHPGNDFDAYAVAALTAATLDQTRRALDELARAHLIQPARPGRHGMHDLLRAYARELADAHEGKSEQHAALTRLFDYYLYTAATAMDALVPAERHRRPRILPPDTPVPSVADAAAARAWLDRERATLGAVTAHMAEYGWPTHATRLATTLYRYLDSGGHYPEAMLIYGHARRAAADTGDQAAEANALTNLGVFYQEQGHYEEAISRFRQALTLSRQTGDPADEGRALGNLGITYSLQGRYDQAAGYYQQALALFRQTGNQPGEIAALLNLGDIDTQRGHYPQATERLERALALSRDTAHPYSEARALVMLGLVDLRLGRYQQAVGRLQPALTWSRETGDRACETVILNYLGLAELRLDRYQQAAASIGRALSLSRETGDRENEAEALNSLGEVLRATGHDDQARAQHGAALGLASEIGHRAEQARAHHGLGDVYHSGGQADKARRHWREALDLYAQLGAPEAGEVRARLAAAERDGHPEWEPSRAPVTTARSAEN
jgi:DNA-binding SARP family transcriptional activator/tetratricopeptide (TPR) repeat protein